MSLRLLLALSLLAAVVLYAIYRLFVAEHPPRRGRPPGP